MDITIFGRRNDDLNSVAIFTQNIITDYTLKRRSFIGRSRRTSRIRDVNIIVFIII